MKISNIDVSYPKDATRSLVVVICYSPTMSGPGCERGGGKSIPLQKVAIKSLN